MAATDSRIKSPHRQNGFSIHGGANSSSAPSATTSSNLSSSSSPPFGTAMPHTRTDTSSTLTLRSDRSRGMSANGTRKSEDGDVEMDDGSGTTSNGIRIPKSQIEARSMGAVTAASQTPSDVSTPSDLLSTSAAAAMMGLRKTPNAPQQHRLPSLTSAPSSVPGWSPANTGSRQASESHHYGNSSNGGRPGSFSSGWGSYSSVKPYLKTSFQTSNERSGTHFDDDDDEDEDDDENAEDVFGHTASTLGLSAAPRYISRQRGRAAAVEEDMVLDGEGDASGVFSFSSPYLGPQSVEDSVPPPSPPSVSRAPPAPVDRLLSPSVTARSLQKLSLGGGVEMSASPSNSSTNGVGASRRARPVHAHSYHNAGPSAYSRSLPSNSAGLSQARRLSASRTGRPVLPPTSVSAYSISPGAANSGAGMAAMFGNATLYSRSPSGNSPYGRSPGGAGMMRPSPYSTAPAFGTPTHNGRGSSAAARERSRSRQRWAEVPQETASRTVEVAQSRAEEDAEDEDDEDDEETDDEMSMAVVEGQNGNGPPSAFAPSSMPRSTSFTAAPKPQAAAAAAAVPSSDGTSASDEMTEVSLIRDRLGGAANCAAFISKLWFLVIHPDRYGKYLHWNATGTTVILSTDVDISNEFASDVLPRLWNHANYSSFIRQMNLYGFQRLPSSRILEKAEVKAAVDAGIKGIDGEIPTELSTAQQLYGHHSSFLHPKFVRGREDLLPQLKPRNAKKPKAASTAGNKKADGGGDGDEGGAE
ncbi:unnamed protein product [Jaminaea pallidilutea]